MKNIETLRPYLNWAKVNDLAGLPANTIYKHLHYLDGGKFGIKFPEQHKPALRKACRELAEMLIAVSDSEG
jgi:hypothetical protein